MKSRNVSCLCLMNLLIMQSAGLMVRAQTQLRQYTTLSYKPSANGCPLVLLRLNEHYFGTFAVDTGTSASMITDTMAAKMGLTRKPLIGDDGLPRHFLGVPVDYVSVPKVMIGQLPIMDYPLVVIDAGKLSDVMRQPLDGLIGANFFTQCAASFDFQKHEIGIWYPGNFSDEEVKQMRFSPEDVIPLTIMKDKTRFAVTVHCNDEADEDLPVDTGSGITLLSPQLVQKLKLKPKGPGAEFSLLSGTEKLDRARLHKLALGKQVFENFIIVYSENKNTQQPPALGLDILSQFRVLLDVPNKKLYLKRVPVEETGKKEVPDKKPPQNP